MRKFYVSLLLVAALGLSGAGIFFGQRYLDQVQPTVEASCSVDGSVKALMEQAKEHGFNVTSYSGEKQKKIQAVLDKSNGGPAPFGEWNELHIFDNGGEIVSVVFAKDGCVKGFVRVMKSTVENVVREALGQNL